MWRRKIGTKKGKPGNLGIKIRDIPTAELVNIYGVAVFVLKQFYVQYINVYQCHAVIRHIDITAR
jgi:hypothetical protein